MVIVLGVILGIIDVTLRVMAPFIECSRPAQDLADDVVTCLVQHALTFQHLTRRFSHDLQLAA